jgi:hypothetical protein
MGVFELTHQVGVRRPNGEGPMQRSTSAQGAVVHGFFLSYLVLVLTYAASADDAAKADAAFQAAGSPGR